MISLRAAHYQTGIFVAIFLCLFTLTGLLLQHTQAIKLDSRFAPAWLATPIYGVQITAATHYRLEQRWLSGAASRLYLDGELVPSISLDDVRGAILTAGGIWVARSDELILLSQQGEVFDRLSTAEGLPERIIKIGKNQRGDLIAATASGNRLVTADMRFTATSSADKPIFWSEQAAAGSVPAPLEQQILRHANNHLITWERVITDLHSGQIFGSLGRAAANLISLLIILVAATGIVMWFKPRD